MKKNTLITLLILIALIILVPILFRPKDATAPANEEVKNGKPQIEGTINDLVSFSILPGQEVSGKQVITGVLKGGYFFEANVITNILDANKKVLVKGHGTVVGDWMTSNPVSFTTTLDFTNQPKGPAFIEIHNDNASGLPENDKSILVPIVIK